MTNYLIRRIFQMALVIFLAALFTYFLFNISPGGPLAGIQQQQRRITREDLARPRARTMSWISTGRCASRVG